MIRNKLAHIRIIFVSLVILAILGVGFWIKSIWSFGELQKIRIGNVGEYTIFNPLAKDKGYFLKNGLDAQITEYETGAPSMADLLAGKVDVAIAAGFVGVRNIFDHPELRIIAEAGIHQGFQVVARKDKGINNPEDLRGKTIGVTKKTAGEFFLGNFLVLNNLGYGNVETVDLPPPKLIEELTKGDLDAVVTFEPHVYNLKKILGDKLVVWSAQGNQDTFVLVYSTEGFIKAHPDIISRYLSSLVDADNYTKNNVEDVKDFIVDKFNFDKDYVEYSWPKSQHRVGLTQELLLTMDNEARFSIRNKLTDKTEVPNYLNFIYKDALMKVKPEAVTIY